MFKFLISVVLVGLMLTAGALVANLMVSTRPAPSEKASALPPPLVQTVWVRRETVTETVMGYGSARPYRSALLSVEVAGEIVELAEGLRDGSPVEAGQLLMRIDDRRYVQALAQATARAEAEQAQLGQVDVREANLRRLLAICEGEVTVNRDEERRLADLFEKEAASKKEYDFARLAYQRSLRESTAYQNQLELIGPQRRQFQASLQVMLAEVEMAKLDVEHCRILAPFDGQIDELLVEVGERVQRGSPIAELIDPWRIEVPVELPLSAFPRVRPGAAVELRVDSMPDLVWSGRVERKSPDADQESRTFRAYVEVDNREQSTPLVAGCFLSAAVTGPTLEDALLIPRGAIVDDGVFVANAVVGRLVGCYVFAERREVEVRRFLGEQAVIRSGLLGGERIIVTNLDRVEQGGPIRLTQAMPARGPGSPAGSAPANR
jgi:RND family efflux transporter MFP subunit